MRETFPVTYDEEDGRFLYTEDDGCGKSLDEGQIVGGKEAKIGELPFMALLGYRKPGLGIAYQCGGTLINRYVTFSKVHLVIHINTDDKSCILQTLCYISSTLSN